MDFKAVKYNDLCQFLEWDSKFFNLRIAQVNLSKIDNNLTQRILRWCNTNEIDCLYFLCDMDDEISIQVVESNKFHLTDIRTTLRYLSKIIQEEVNHDQEITIRLCRHVDIPYLRAIAKENHTGTRFYSDKNFSKSNCDELYETWIEQSCNGYADAVFVAIIGNQPVGYITCHMVEEYKGKIGLLGVKKEWRNNSIGSSLLCSAKRWFLMKDISQIDVVTQGNNYPAQRFYSKHGFFVERVQLWYHLWFCHNK